MRYPGLNFSLTAGALQVTRYLGYSSLKDFFPSMEIKPNPGCPNPLCGKLQAAYQEHYNSEAAVSARKASAAAAAEAAEEQVVHEDNSWGISVMPEEASASEGEHVQSAHATGALAEGIEYSMPVRIQSTHICGLHVYLQ